MFSPLRVCGPIINLRIEPSMITSDRPFVASHPRLGDEARIDVTDLREVEYWIEALGVTETQLRVAVAAVGAATQDVRDHLGK